MEWQEIVFKLLDDEMIQSCSSDGLYDAIHVLNGLFGMSEIMSSSPRFNNKFILEAINLSIKTRNKYCSLNNTDELPYIKLVGDEFIWNK